MKLLLAFIISIASVFGQIVVINGTDTISSSRTTINNNFSFLASSKAARWTGSGAPTLFSLSIRGDIYLDTVGNNTYICFATMACSAVGPGNWVLLAGGGGGGGSSFTSITAGTNTTSLNMGAGGTLSFVSSGVINANKILGVDFTTLTGIPKLASGVASIATANTDYQLPFTTTNDTNITGSLSGSVYTLGFAGTLAAGRLNSNTPQSVVNDTNITGVISSQVLTLGWTGVLAKARIIGTAVYNDQANTYSAGLQDFHSATMRLSETVVGSLPTASSNTNHVYVVTDGTSASDCTVGSGSTRALCISNGTIWTALGGGGGGATTPGGSTNDIQVNVSSAFAGGRCTMDGSQNIVCLGDLTAGNGSGNTGKLKLTGKTSLATSVVTVDDNNTAATLKLPNDATAGLYIPSTTSAAPSSGCAQFNGTSTELTSTGTSCASAGANPGGSNSEYQYRSSSTIFGGVTNTGPVPVSSWTAVNGGKFNNFSADEIGMFIQPNSGTVNYRGAVRSSTISGTPYTVIESLDCGTINSTASQAQSCGLWLYDGTKIEVIEMIQTSGALSVRVLTGTTTSGGTYVVLVSASNVAPSSHATLKVSDNGSNRVWSYYVNGAFTTLLTETTGTFLTPTAAGFGGVDLTTSGAFLSMNLKYLCVSASTTCNGL